MDLAGYATEARKELVTNILPFWMKYGFDRKNGGVYTCLDRDGTLMDPTKSVWFQGRFGWMMAYAYNVVRGQWLPASGFQLPASGFQACATSHKLKANSSKLKANSYPLADWLAASKSCCEFLEKHCFDRDGRAYFEVTAEGVGLRKRRYVFSESFAAIAYAEYALASGDGAWAEKAVEMFKRIRKFCAKPEKYMPAKYEPAMAAQGHSLTMIMINVANVLKRVSDDPVLDEQITESVEKLVKYFIRPEFKCVLETVGPNGEFIDTMAGRVINPGHAIETSWFLMDVAVARGDEALKEIALKVLDWSWDWGWDRKYGGIISFRDCRNFPPQCYEQDMKFWWPQCEAIIANLYAYRLTGKKKYFDRFVKSHDWAWSHLKDRKYPEWYGYLHRDGTVAQPAKGNIFKGPFHIPRMLVKVMELAGGER